MRRESLAQSDHRSKDGKKGERERNRERNKKRERNEVVTGRSAGNPAVGDQSAALVIWSASLTCHNNAYRGYDAYNKTKLAEEGIGGC